VEERGIKREREWKECDRKKRGCFYIIAVLISTAEV
jgi:hypothetical protein